MHNTLCMQDQANAAYRRMLKRHLILEKDSRYSRINRNSRNLQCCVHNPLSRVCALDSRVFDLDDEFSSPPNIGLK
jgi:hypothetical protein